MSVPESKTTTTKQSTWSKVKQFITTAYRWIKQQISQFLGQSTNGVQRSDEEAAQLISVALHESVGTPATLAESSYANLAIVLPVNDPTKIKTTSVKPLANLIFHYQLKWPTIENLNNRSVGAVVVCYDHHDKDFKAYVKFHEGIQVFKLQNNSIDKYQGSARYREVFHSGILQQDDRLAIETHIQHEVQRFVENPRISLINQQIVAPIEGFYPNEWRIARYFDSANIIAQVESAYHEKDEEQLKTLVLAALNKLSAERETLQKKMAKFLQNPQTYQDVSPKDKLFINHVLYERLSQIYESLKESVPIDTVFQAYHLTAQVNNQGFFNDRLQNKEQFNALQEQIKPQVMAKMLVEMDGSSVTPLPQHDGLMRRGR